MKMNFIFIFGDVMQYNTKQKERVTAVLREANGAHLTAEDIAGALAPIGMSTVYRQLDRLCEQGVVRRFFVEEGVRACYQYVGEDCACRNHYHLKCSVCGKLLHVECSVLDEMASHVFEHHGFAVQPEKTVLYGVCEACRKKKETT